MHLHRADNVSYARRSAGQCFRKGLISEKRLLGVKGSQNAMIVQEKPPALAGGFEGLLYKGN